jgi:CRP/FNR family transcriptional regulator, nitrogen oxide reductase regulator
MSNNGIAASTVSLLSRVPLLAGLPERDLLALAALTRADHYEREALIFSQGEPAERIWLLRDGRVKIIHQEEDGREVILEVVSPGEVFGGTVLFMPSHPATAIAMTDVDVVSFPGEAYRRLIDTHPEIGRKLIAMLGARLRSMMGLQIMAGERVERRLAHILIKLANRAGRPDEEGTLITVPLSRQDLADMAGTTLETAIRTMSRFRTAGWVKTRRGGYVVITHMDGLQQQAQSSRS